MRVRSGNWWNSNSKVAISLLTDIRISIYLTALDWGCSLLSHFYCRADHPLSFWLLNHFLTSLPKWPRKFIKRYLHQNFHFFFVDHHSEISLCRRIFTVALTALLSSFNFGYFIDSSHHCLFDRFKIIKRHQDQNLTLPTLEGVAHSLKKLAIFI